jgi:hypothetical protein
MTSTEQTPTLTLSQISEQTQTLISENNILIGKMIAKLNNDLLLKIENLSNPTIIVPKTRRTRTITPVSEDEKCTSFVVSGKNKGGRCSKKATKGSLCTMHHKKIEPIQSTLSEEFVKSDDDVSTAYVSTTPRASIVEFSL